MRINKQDKEKIERLHKFVEWVDNEFYFIPGGGWNLKSANWPTGHFPRDLLKEFRKLNFKQLIQ